jgi:hypothetical protein
MLNNFSPLRSEEKWKPWRSIPKSLKIQPKKQNKVGGGERWATVETQ